MYRAGYPRVTHPSAAWFCSELNILDLEYSILSKPSLDLHVLGTPPAFILSQDQTLIKSVCLVQNELTLIFAHSVIDRLKSIIFTVHLGYTNVTICMRSFEFSRLSHYLVIKVLIAYLLFAIQLCYSITSSGSCQHLFLIIFNLI